MIASPPLPQGTNGINLFYRLSVILIAFNALVKISINEHVAAWAYRNQPETGSDIPIDLDIQKLSSSSVKVVVNWYSKDFSELHVSSKELEMKLRYQLMLPNISPDFCKTEQPNMKAPLNDLSQKTYSEFIQTCKSKVFMFGGFNDTIGTDYSYMLELCQPKDIYIKKRGENEPRDLIITDLLPRQSYSFHVYISHNDNTIISNTRTRVVCTPNSAPIYPPQTDFGSFRVSLPSEKEIRDNKNLTDMRGVNIYFRPVPDIITSPENLNYTLQCVGKDHTYNKTDLTDSYLGKTVIHVPRDKSYTCFIWSRNLMGRSANSSVITIPQQKYIINTRGKFNLYVTAVTKGSYILRWTDMNELLKNDEEISRDVRSLLPNDTRTYTRAYTIYWCTLEAAQKACQSIEGMAKTVNTTWGLQIPALSLVPHRIFGVSFRSAGNKLFTGITWSTCVGNVILETHSMSDPLKIHHNGVSDERSISVSWNFEDCNGVTALIKEYEINYCIYGAIDPCGLYENPPVVTGEWDWSNESCSVYTLENNLKFDTRIMNLKSSTTYIVRMRAVMEGCCEYSAPVLASTQANPKTKKNCQRGVITIIGAFSLIFIGLVAGYFVAKRYSVHYLKVISRYHQTNTTMPQRLLDNDDNHSDTGLRYWINRLPMGGMCQAANHESKNIYKFDAKTKTITEINIDNDIKENYENAFEDLNSADYIPNPPLSDSGIGGIEMIRRNNRRDSLSDTDDVSVCSHSSFLANILNDKPNSGNNSPFANIN